MSHKSISSEKDLPLSKTDKRNLYYDIESSGLPPRAVDFDALCDSKPSIYKKSKKRLEQYRNHWYRTRRKSFDSYVKILASSKYTTIVNEDFYNSTMSDEEDNNSLGSVLSDDMNALNESMAGMDFSSPKKKKDKTILKTPVKSAQKKTPPRHIYNSDRKSSVGKSKSTHSSSRSSRSNEPIHSGPFWLIHADSENNANNREFDVVPIQGFAIGNDATASGFFIRKNIDVLDSKKWSAKVPETLPEDFEDYIGRSVLVTGPNVSSYTIDAAKFHKSYKKAVDCEATRMALLAQQQKYRRMSEDQKQSKWLIVFDCFLDNQILTKSATEIETHIVGVPIKDSRGNKSTGFSATWRIAEWGTKTDLFEEKEEVDPYANVASDSDDDEE